MNGPRRAESRKQACVVITMTQLAELVAERAQVAGPDFGHAVAADGPRARYDRSARSRGQTLRPHVQPCS